VLGVGVEVELLFTDDEDPMMGLPGVLEVPELEEFVAAEDDATGELRARDVVEDEDVTTGMEDVVL